MNEAKKRDYLIDFSKHVPDILLQQLIVSQAHRYTNTSSPGTLSISMGHDNGSVVTNPGTISNGISPSIQRFYGALLSIDISGFTSLSQKFDVESLKNYINGYFTRILEIVDKWGGDVVKFAGDVLYVVWPAEVDQVVDSQQQQQWIPSKNHDQRFNLGRSGSSHGSKRSNKHSNTLRSSTFAKVGHSSKKTMLKQFASDVTTRAINCGMEIIEQCGDLPVLLDSNINQKFEKSTGRLSSFVSSITSRILARNAVIAPDQQGILNNDSLAYLDIHAGVATGLMAGIDIGLDDRWEYFIIGSPISDVATAESMAKKGNIVVSAGAHSLFHPLSSICTNTGIAETGILSSTEQKIAGGVLLTCGCTQLNDQCILLRHTEMCSNNTGTIPFNDANIDRSPAMSTTMQVQASRSKLVSNAFSPANLHLYETENISLYESVCSEIRRSMAFVTPMMREAYCNALMAHCKAQSVLDPTHSEGLSQEEDIAFNVKMLEKRLPAFLQNKVRPHFFACIERGLIDQLIGHLHDVVRPDNYILFPRYNAKEENFEKALKRFLSEEKMRSRQPTIDKYAFAKILQAVDNNVAHSNSQIEIGSSHDELDEPLALEPIQKTLPVALSTKSQIVQHNIEAELRSVTVMFINIDGFDMSLIVDTSVPKDGRWTRNGTRLGVGYNPVFEFLDRTENEMMADQLILLRLQQCLEVLHRAIYENGGQMRQFMVDDKGTVCIASFGLRGSVNEDNAANALEAANAIILGLQKQNLSSSIGVTTGKVYCGLVGSMMRHEFALMGPSVNLSARLMCKATMGSILCDHETMHRDRAHDFKHVGDIKAKGYEHPVPTYRQAVEGSGKVHFGSLSFGSLRPFLQKFSSHLNMSMSYDNTGNHLYPSLSLDCRVESGPMHSKLARILNSDFVVVDQVNTFHVEALKFDDNESTVNNASIQNNNILGISRVLRGRKKEVAQLMEFLFVDSGRDVLLFDYEAMSRLAVVVGNGGLGKTALLSAIGRKIISSAKQDPAVNVVVLRNRSNVMSSSSRQHPWKPILLEILRVVKRVMDSSAEARGAARKQRNHGKVNVRRESLQDFVVALDVIFKHLPAALQSYKPMINVLLNFNPTLNEQRDDDHASFDHFSNSFDKPVKAEDLKLIMNAILNFCVSYTKKIMLVMIENVQSISVDAMEVLHYLWMNCRGVHFLITTTTTYRPDVNRSMSSFPVSLQESVDSTPVVPRTMSTAEIVDNSDLFGAFAEEGRFLRLNLEPLSKEASMELAQDMVLESDPHTMESIVASSGGNPLYIVQLTKALIEEGSQEVHEVRHSVANISAMCRRVEEIICYRLDQLDQLCQAVLKVASVAASHGKSFTPNIIAFALKKTIRQLQPGLVISRSTDHLLHSPLSSVSAPVDGLHHASCVYTIDPRVRDIVLQVMSTLKERNEFIHIIKPLQSEPKSLHDQDTSHGDDAFLGLEEVRFDTEFEFRIPTEQSTIYSLIIDEQREYFHGKIAQYFYRLRYDNTDFGAAASVSTSARHESSIPLSRASSLKSHSSKRLSHVGNKLTLQWLLSCEQEISFHAEQAKLWSLAMRAYLHVGILSRRLHNIRQFVGGMLEAYKIVRCCEHESGDTVTPLPLSYLHLDKSEKVLHTVPGIIAQMYLTGEINENDVGIISEKLEPELECVYNVFGSDPSTIILAAKLNLYLAEIYLLAFGEARLVPEILGIAMKLSIAARVCVTENLSIKSGIASTAEAMDEDQLIFFDSEHATSISTIEDSDLAHFVFTHFNLVRADPTSDFALRNTWKECEMFETLFESAEGAVGYDALRVLEALSKGDVSEAKSLWSKARIWSNESQMLVYILRFGQDIHIFASSVLLQHLVYANQTDMVDAILARIDYLLQLHNYSLLVFMAIVPAIHAMALLGNWEVIGQWIQRMYQEIDEAHEIMVAQISLVRSLHQWLSNWLPLANISLPLVIGDPAISLQKPIQHPQMSRNVSTIPEGFEDDPGSEGTPQLQEGDAVAAPVRKASRQEMEETHLVLRIMANMHSPGETASTAAARRRSSIAYFSSSISSENLYTTALFFLRPDRPAVAPETLPKNSMSSTLSTALEQWNKALPPTIARFISHCGISVESLGIQLLAMWFIHTPLHSDSSHHDRESHREAEGVFRSAAGHLVSFAVNFVDQVHVSSHSAHQEKSKPPGDAMAANPTLKADSLFLANLVFTVAMLQPLRTRCSLIDECLLGTGTPFQQSLLKLVQSERSAESTISDKLRASCAFLFNKLESLLLSNSASEPVFPGPSI